MTSSRFGPAPCIVSSMGGNKKKGKKKGQGAEKTRTKTAKKNAKKIQKETGEDDIGISHYPDDMTSNHHPTTHHST